MALVVDGGGLVNKGSALGTGQACCCNKCSGPCPEGVSECAPGCGCKDSQCVPCSGPCDEENPCPEGCVCVDGECVTAGACCWCPEQNDYAWMGQPAVQYCTSDTEYAEEQQNQMEFDNALLAVRIQEAEDAGFDCLISVYSEIISLGSCPAPELGLEGTGTAKRRTAAYLNFACCGVIDVDAPFFNHFPLCIQGPERACEDGVTAENCAARCNSTHHPGQTCAEEPCEGEAP